MEVVVVIIIISGTVISALGAYVGCIRVMSKHNRIEQAYQIAEIEDLEEAQEKARELGLELEVSMSQGNEKICEKVVLVQEQSDKKVLISRIYYALP